MFWQFPLTIQRYTTATDTWDTLTIPNEGAFLEFCQGQFKLPGQYHLRNTRKWKETGLKYERSCTKPNLQGGRYHPFVRNTINEKRWKETEKGRILSGVIYDDVYVPPFYYWYLNFCPIYDDLQKKKRFADVWDGDLWYFHYAMLCILQGKHIGGIKGRQKGYSFKHMAILYWCYSWFENSVSTVGGYQEDLVKKSWRYLEGYRNHINQNTTWRRGPTIPKSLEWYEVQYDENNQAQGLNSKLAGVTFKQRPDNDVGGAQTIFNYEEPGVSPTLLETLEFIRPAVEKGSEVTGIIIACGSVGKLEDAQGIKTIFYNPRDYGFLPIKNIWDKKSGIKECCIFISEAYNMIGRDKEGLVEKDRAFMDADGNSDVDFALAWIAAKAKQMQEGRKKADLKQLALSQKCISPEQAFASRSVSEFPIEALERQQQRIMVKEQENRWEFKPLKCVLYEDDNGKVCFQTTRLPQEHEYPIDPEWEDKRGVVTIYEPPDENPKWLTNFAGVDTVEVDVTTTSDSIMTVDIYKRTIKELYTDEKGKTRTRFTGGKIVATYRGRYDPVEKGNEQAWLLIKLYNAFAYVERSKPNFINYMKRFGRSRYLAKESDVPIYKDLNHNGGLSTSNYGFHLPSKDDNAKKGQVWKALKDMVKEYFNQEFDRRENEETGEVYKIYTGIDRIDDYWLLEEYKLYNDRDNFDRVISSAAAITIGKVYEDQIGIPTVDNRKRDEEKAKAYRPPRQVNLLGGGARTTFQGSRGKRPRSML